MVPGQENKIRREENPEQESEQEQPHLLVVDDDNDILRIVQFFLSKQKFKVHTANNGEEALAVLEVHPDIDLILSDVMMPKLNGLELLKKVRSNKRYSEIPMILISAEGETSQKVTGLNMGADDFITKPFNFDELMARVRNHLRLRRLQKDLLHANEQLQYRNQMLIDDLETAKDMQMALMPDSFPENTEYSIGAQYIPVDKVGGDFFDVVVLEEGKKVGVLIVDVCGHGVGAAFITAITKITFRNACYAQTDPAAVLGRMNRELFLNLKGGYITAFYAVYDVTSKMLTYASGGHPPLLVHRRSHGDIIKLEPQATFLGIFNPVEFSADEFQLLPGDRIFFYTDGLFESHNGAEDQFGMERVAKLIRENPESEIQPLLDLLLRNLREFVGECEVDDDITLVGMDILS
ncbi:MAG: fused response regulator/phosphatase [SAR324 cluster bacterium]|nr:fused response regulator/phosphatase [SAR324 cluster bacterium]